MIFSMTKKMGEKGKGCQSRVCHVWTGYSPFSFFPEKVCHTTYVQIDGQWESLNLNPGVLVSQSVSQYSLGSNTYFSCLELYTNR